MIQLIAQIFTIGIAAFVGFGIGWIYRNETWVPRPQSDWIESRTITSPDFYKNWDDFQDRKRSEKVDILTILDWEEEIKTKHIN